VTVGHENLQYHTTKAKQATYARPGPPIRTRSASAIAPRSAPMLIVFAISYDDL
jgi:hypothetical protein